MQKLARSLHLSYAHFRRIFKQQTGLSPYQYHLQLRINRAREMLHGTTLTVKQVARQLNFENAYHFSKIFKRKAGMAAGSERKSLCRPQDRRLSFVDKSTADCARIGSSQDRLDCDAFRE
jgi:transcriptional regulator GlxA family with amidase domain